MSPWQTRPLSDVASVIRGISFDKSQVSDTPSRNSIAILRAGNIQESLLTDSDLVYVPNELVSDEQRMRRGDLAICMSSGSPTIVGKTAHLENDWGGSVGAFCALIRFNSKLHHRFGSYWFRSPAFLQWRDSCAKGANIQNLRRTELERLSIPVPPLSEQERFVKLLDEADALRKLRNQADQRTDVLIPAIFNEMFTDDSKWPVEKLGNLCERVTVGHVGPMATEYVGSGVTFLRGQNIKRGRLNLSSVLFVSKDFHRRLEKSAISPGDVVSVRTGKPGITAVIPPSLAMANCADLIVMTCGPQLNPHFLCELLNQRLGDKETIAGATGIAQQHFNIGEARRLKLSVPPITLQNLFAQRVANLCELEAIQSASRQRLDDLFQSMLHRAFNGEL